MNRTHPLPPRHHVNFDTLGETWINLVDLTSRAGVPQLDGIRELLGVNVVFPARAGHDPVIDRFGDARLIAEMRKTFFESTPNASGHSYAGLMRGPGGRSDLQDVIALLRENQCSKRGVVTIGGVPGGTVPCINVVQFMARAGVLQTMYYARGQDAFRKFYADGLCLAAMARTVAEGLGLPAGAVTGFVASSHVYDADRDDIRALLENGRSFLRAAPPEGAG